MSLALFEASGHQGPAQAADRTGPASAHQAPQAAGHQAQPQASQHPVQPQASGHQGSPQTTGATPSMDRSGDPDGLQDRAFMARFTTATGYVATGLLAVTLLIGPANLLLRKPNPVSSYLRRDVGAWTAVISVVHVIAGFQVHGPMAPLGERIVLYFFAPDGSPLVNAFGLGNWTGLAATVIVVGLLAISSDFALRKLKFRNWKWLQRSNYALFALVIAHAIYYGALLRVTSPSTLLLGLSVVAVFIGQLVGVWLWRRRYLRALAQSA
jgi:sulfoxide reductase heme-binding subunit YedZ